ncbi:MAG: 4-(cytidine 5'-diphospho)-2-C-methyl-D-erythritol kinase [Mycoplasma sp.]
MNIDWIKAYAKVNIGLNVYTKDDDSLKHRIESIFMLTYDYFDLIEIHESEEMNVEFFDNGVKKEFNNNNCLLVLQYLSTKFNININNKFIVHKNIPEKAGLGGSSTDAGTIAKYIISKYKLKLSKEDYLHIALNIGSDIPFFIEGYELALVSNYGDIVKELKLTLPKIIIHSNNQHSNTAEIFNSFDQFKGTLEKNDFNKIINNWCTLKNSIIINNLETFALENDNNLRLIKKEQWILTGSGSFFIEIIGD